MKKKQIVDIKVADIKVDDRVREEKDYGDIEELAKSITEKGLMHPLVVNRVEDGYHLVAGGRRLEAIKLLEWESVACRFYEDLTEVEAKELELEENIRRQDIPYSTVLTRKKELFELRQEKHGVTSGENPKGYTQKDLAEDLGESQATISQDLLLADFISKVPAVKDVIRTKADAQKLVKTLKKKYKQEKREEAIKDRIEQGQLPGAKIDLINRFIVCDWFEKKPFPAGSADLVWIDSPFAIDLNEKKKEGADTKAAKSGDYSEWDAKDFIPKIKESIEDAYRLLKEDGWFILFFGIQWYGILPTLCKNAGFKVGSEIKLGKGKGSIYTSIPAVWSKGSGQTLAPSISFGRGWQPFFYFRKGNPTLVRGRASDVFDYRPINPEAKSHRTEMPVEFMEDVLGKFCNPDDTVYDIFCGSGNLILAGANFGVKVFGVDSNQAHKDRFSHHVDVQDIGMYNSYDYNPNK